MRAIQMMDLTPANRHAAPKRTQVQPKDLSDLSRHEVRLIRITVRALLGQTLSREALRRKYRVSRATAMRDLRVLLSVLRDEPSVRVERSNRGVYRASLQQAAGGAA